MKTVSTLFIALVNETRKGLLIQWAYRANVLSNVVALSITFVGVSFIIDNGQLNPARMASTLLGYLMWYYVMLLIGDMSESLTDEAKVGTLEQMFITPVPISVVLIGRSVADLVLATIQVLLIGGALIVVLQIPLTWRLDALPVILIACAGMFGMGFMLAGLTLVYKQIYAAATVMTNVLIFMNGALAPISQFPPWLIVIAKILPSTLGIAVLRSVLLNGASLVDVWEDGSLPLLILHSAAYFVVGWLVLRFCTGIAKRQGSLGAY